MPNHAKLNIVREHASAIECDLGRPLAQSTSHVQNPLRIVDDTPQLHDASGTITTMRAWNPRGYGNGIQYQDIRCLYESPFDGSFATSTIYPDSSDTTSSGTNQVKTAYDAGGPRRVFDEADERSVRRSAACGAPGFDRPGDRFSRGSILSKRLMTSL